MGLFKSKEEKELDRIINSIAMNMANNYKDNAQDGLRELEMRLNEYVASGKISGKKLANYSNIYDDYKVKMKGYSHKDQKPYWT